MIKSKNLVKKFDDNIAINNISFEIKEGTIFGLVGSNGAGKSTFLRLLSGIYKPDGGSLQIDDLDVFENQKVKEQIAFVPDVPYFFDNSNVINMSKLYSKVYPNWSDKKFKKYCDLFPIDPKKKISTMSKGMQRQVSLILALSTNPRCLLLDEVFDGLDPVVRQLLRKIISEEVGSENITVIIASHNLRELEDLCDYVGFFHQGEVVLKSELDDLKLGVHKIQTAYMPSLDKESFGKLNLDIVKMDQKGTLYSFVIRGNEEEILNKLKSLKPVFIESIPLTLEEVFISEMEDAGYDIENIIK